MEIIGRDKVEQTGDQSSVKIDNRQPLEKRKWHQTWWGQSTIAFAVVVVGGAILYFFGMN